MTTPAEITDQIRQFSDSLVPGAVPVWVHFDPLNSGAVDECYANVAEVVRTRGGRSLLGWTIWEWPDILLEAISHAVWEGDDGELLDPTPKVDGEQTTVFIPDRNATDDGGVTLARHWPLSNWPEIAEYIDVCQQIGVAQQQYYPVYEGVPQEVWGPLLLRKENLATVINRRRATQQSQDRLSEGLELSEVEAAARFSASLDDIEASTTLARHFASRGDFGSAFGTLIKTAELDRQRATEVRETFIQLFEACENKELVQDFRRRLSVLLY